MSWIKNIKLFQANFFERCVSVFFASVAQIGNFLYYIQCQEDKDSNTLIYKKLNLFFPKEEDEIVSKWKIDRPDKTYNIVGACINKQFINYSKERKPNYNE